MFTVCSFLCGIAGQVCGELILFRLLQGFSSAAVFSRTSSRSSSTRSRRTSAESAAFSPHRGRDRRGARARSDAGRPDLTDNLFMALDFPDQRADRHVSPSSCRHRAWSKTRLGCKQSEEQAASTASASRPHRARPGIACRSSWPTAARTRIGSGQRLHPYASWSSAIVGIVGAVCVAAVCAQAAGRQLCGFSSRSQFRRRLRHDDLSAWHQSCIPAAVVIPQLAQTATRLHRDRLPVYILSPGAVLVMLRDDPDRRPRCWPIIPTKYIIAFGFLVHGPVAGHLLRDRINAGHRLLDAGV